MMRKLILLSAAFAMTCSTASAQLGLVHRYSFTNSNYIDASAGTISDSIGTLNGTLGSSTSFSSTLGTVFAPTGNPDSNDTITFPSNDIAAISPASGAVSIQFWGEFTWNGDGAPVFTIGDGTGQNAMSDFAGNGQHVFSNVGGTDPSSDLWGLPSFVSFLNNGLTPVDVVNVFNSNTNSMQTYINGTLDFTQSMNGNLLSLMPSSFFTLGGPDVGVGGAGNGSIAGSISEFRIFDTALDPSAVSRRSMRPVPIAYRTSVYLQAGPTDSGPWLPRELPRPFRRAIAS